MKIPKILSNISRLKSISKSTALGLTLFVVFSITRSVSAAPATFTVTNTNDSGAGSFRQAIIDANSNSNPSDMDVINFNISGSGVHTIAPASLYPAITEKVTINGYSQPGSSANTAPAPQPMNGTLTIEFDGVDTSQDLLGINIDADGTVIKGLNMHECRAYDANFESTCLKINGDNILIEGNYFGLMPDGQTAIAATATKGTSVAIGVSPGASGVVIGGQLPAQRNIITNSTSNTTALTLSGTQAVVEGNYVGIAKDGLTGLGMAGGILVEGTENRIGGPAQSQKNVVAGGDNTNINIFGNENIVQGNTLCANYLGAVSNLLPTSKTGVGLVMEAAGNLIGGTNSGEGNLIAGCTGAGVGVINIILPAASINGIPYNNAILGNIIFGITSDTNVIGGKLAITFNRVEDTNNDFVPDVFTVIPYANDSGDADTGVNDVMNYPVITAADQNGSNLNLTYNLDTADSPSNQYRIEFYSYDPSEVGTNDSGMAQTFLGATTASPGSSLSASITLPDNTSLAGKRFTATATAVNTSLMYGFGSTSRFSPIIALTSESNTTASTGSSSSNSGGASSSSALASTGQSNILAVLVSIGLLVSAILSIKFVKASGKSK